MEDLREHEADADRLEAGLDPFGAKVDLDSEGFQDVGAARGAGHGAVAVLGDTHARARDDEGGGRGDVERVGGVSSGACGVHERPFHFDVQGRLTHDLGHTGDLFGGLTLHSEGGDEGADLGLCGLARHD